MEAKKNKGGHPPRYKTPEEMQSKIDGYFDNGVKTRTIIIGKGDNKQAVDVRVPTITGLCLYLGFESRQSFYDYGKREMFSYTIKNAHLRIENEYEELLQYGNVVGAIFALKNLGWEDKSQVDNNVNASISNFNVKDIVNFDKEDSK